MRKNKTTRTNSEMSEAEAKESMLQAVRAKATNDALAIEREVIENAKANANKEAKNSHTDHSKNVC